jgi:S-DNA-T family DNA segregation ATPase FtsK/SpoIIIE
MRPADTTHTRREPTSSASFDEPLRLPTRREPPRRASIPLIASVVPVVGAVVMWAVTGSTMALWFAALGPLIAGATTLDTMRFSRRQRRLDAVEAATARAATARAVTERHVAERARLHARHPDVAGLLGAGLPGMDGVAGDPDPDSTASAGGDDIWRMPDRALRIVVGHGDVPSALRVVGGEGDPEAAVLRARAETLEDAPVTIPSHVGIAVAGPAALAAAVVRALVLQLCLAAPPGRLRLVEATDGAEWVARLPHRSDREGDADTIAAWGPDAASAVPASGFGRAEPVVTFAVCGPGESPPVADIVIAQVAEGGVAPARCAAQLTVTAVARGRLAHDGSVHELAIESVGAGQAAAIADLLAARTHRSDAAGTTTVELAALLPPTVRASTDIDGQPVRGVGSTAVREGLVAVIGHGRRGPMEVDLVADGPHAIVVGVTGAGKSELMITWVTALCATHSTDEVTFLLADFKGGTAFDALTVLPHVTGVITDLDDRGARRALDSLRAELRRREAELVRVGARDVQDSRVQLPRLVIVVDEFAALATAHPELEAVFVDVAARGRALGMHLVLGTQRAAGVLRDAVTANCPLRIALRVTDAEDSRAVIGTDAAAQLPGGPHGRGMALIRRAGDAAPRPARIALASRELVDAVARAAVGPKPRRPWIPELPNRIELHELRQAGGLDDRKDGGTAIALGVADEPERQRRRVVPLGDRGLCVVGTAGSGRTTALAAIGAQVSAHERVWVPAEPERAWDVIAELACDDVGSPSPALVLLDDVDALLAGYPVEYAQVVAERLERIVRGASGRGYRVVMSLQRPSGTAARIADLVPERAVLATPSRIEHAAAGGDPHRWRAGMPPGRAILDGHELQFAWTAPPADVARRDDPVWVPSMPLSGIVVRPGATLDPRFSGVATVLLGEGTTGVGRDVRESLWDGSGMAEDVTVPTVLVGDPEAWQRSRRELAAVLRAGELLVDTACATDYRLLTGDRALPPFCTPGRRREGRRAWLLTAGATPVRVRITGDALRQAGDALRQAQGTGPSAR